ncbi:MAG: quinone oxidoreductase [Pseudomonadota bacterium]
MSAKAVRIHQTGGPEVLSYEEVEVGSPGPGELRLRQTAVGLNYIDTYHRTGLYPLPSLPMALGLEAAGVVEAIGDGVDHLTEGDRVAYGAGPLGAYASDRLMPANRVIKLPDSISDQTAAAMMLQGMTVEYLIRRTYRVQPGDTVLFHAAAGGVGLVACQWLKALGATIIGTVGSAEKGELAKAHGCHHIINYRNEDFTAQVREITDGKGVPVVYDGVGQDTFLPSLDCLSRRGMMVTFGNASGPPPEFSPGLLTQKGSLFVTRPTLMDYVVSDDDLKNSADALLEVVGSGMVQIRVNQTYPLSDVEQAHRDLEGRKTTGSTVLIP